MKTKKFIIWSVMSIVLTSCFSENYRIITQVNRDGSCRREIHFTADSIPNHFPYDISSGWDISEKDTVVDEYLSPKSKKRFIIGKKFYSVNELSNDLQRDRIFPTPNESLKKCFRWFYTCYAFTAVYPEMTHKGNVPMDKYLNTAEQKFYLQGDMSAYKGMTGMELKDELDAIETRFMEWYKRSLYEECFDVILHYAEVDFCSKLPVVKDTLYSMNEKQIKEEPSFHDVVSILNKYFSTTYFSDLYFKNEQEMKNKLEERLKVAYGLMGYYIQYELTMPGKITATNTDLINNDVMTWNINLFRFLADDYTLTAESRAANVWAFMVTLLLIVFAGYCFYRVLRLKFRI